jgi:hypothetical protein
MKMDSSNKPASAYGVKRAAVERRSWASTWRADLKHLVVGPEGLSERLLGQLQHAALPCSMCKEGWFDD